MMHLTNVKFVFTVSLRKLTLAQVCETYDQQAACALPNYFKWRKEHFLDSILWP